MSWWETGVMEILSQSKSGGRDPPGPLYVSVKSSLVVAAEVQHGCLDLNRSSGADAQEDSSGVAAEVLQRVRRDDAH